MQTKTIICVVDDDSSVRRALKRLLKSAGFQVSTFSSAQEFLDDGVKEDPDLIVLDVRMPGLSGLELQRQMTDSGLKIPIVFMTAHENGGVFTTAMECGAVDFLYKPFDDMDLLSAIDAGIKHSDA